VVFEVLQNIRDEDLVQLLNQAAAMAYAPRLEPFGYAPLEANACGTPVIAVAEGGVRETVRDGYTGYLVEADPRAMATAIIRLLDDPHEARKMGEQTVEFAAKNWSLGAAIDRLESYMFDLLSRGHKANGFIGFDKNEYWKNWTA
jgi:glycosyltransferase involved in cell wall biosynthesis